MYKNILIIIPAYNEEKTITAVLRDLLTHNFTNILVVDDGSSDQTYRLIKKYPVKVLRHQVNLGYGAALKTGFHYALQKGFPYSITFDGDGQHLSTDLEKIAKILINSNYDIVFGNRLSLQKENSFPFPRKQYILLANFINKILKGININDSQCGLRAYTRKALTQMNLKSRGMGLSLEILQEIRRCDLSFTELDITPVYTEYSKSKGQNFFMGIKTLYELIIKEF